MLETNQTIDIAKELEEINYQVAVLPRVRRDIEKEYNTLFEWYKDFQVIDLNQLHGFVMFLGYSASDKVSPEGLEELKNQLQEYDAGYVQQELPEINKEELLSELPY